MTETRMIERGERRGRKLLLKDLERGRMGETPAGVALARRGLEPLAEAIKEFIERSLSGEPGRNNHAAVLMKDLDPYLLAHVTFKTILTCASQQSTVSLTARRICSSLELELIPRMVREKAEGLYVVAERNAKEKTQSPERVAHAIIRAGAEHEDTPTHLWTSAEKVHMGAKLIDLFIETIGIIETQKFVQNRKTKFLLKFSPKIDEWIKDYNERAYLNSPMFLPTVEPPLPWEGPSKGAFKDIQVDIITKPTPKRLALLEQADLSMVYESINRLQETAWEINTEVLEVMRHLWESGADYDFMPHRDDWPIPPVPEEVHNDKPGGPHRKAWRKKLRRIHEYNAASRSKRFEFARAIAIADEYAEGPLYFVYRMDFRGRVYALSTTMSPQGPDNVRGLLRFHNGKSLDDRARWWLGIHGANLYGEDKISLEDRYQWACNFDVQEIVADPIGTASIWGEADDPWQFLAWCFEWARRDEEGFISRLPIHLDGSCNGIQHYSAMLRDPVGGKAVNLIPSETPQDIYQEVADKVVEMLADYTEDDPDFWRAQSWLVFGVDRKITKRAVMVLPYGGTMFSCQAYVRDAVREKIADGMPSPFGEDALPKEAAWLASKVWAAISEVVIAARAAMNWLHEVAAIMSEHNLPIQWTTPSGFVVLQDYKAVKYRKIKTKFQGSLVYFSIYSDTNQVDRQKQKTALAPNFVHSMDAATLMHTIRAASQLGIDNFAMIHDSYATLAADTDMLATAIRATFYVFYQENDVLEQFRQEVQTQLPEGVELPPPPERGDLDLIDVMRSDYFFA